MDEGQEETKDEESETQASIEEKPTEEPEEKPIEEEPCDPATMTCNEMRDQIINLAGQRATLDIGIKSLENTKKIIPSESLDKAYDESVTEKQKVDDEIYGLFERFIVCAAKPEPKPTEEPTEEKPTEETPEESSEQKPEGSE